MIGRAHLYYLDRQYLKAEKMYLRFIENEDEKLECILSQYLAWVYYHLSAKKELQKYCQICLMSNPSNMHALFLEATLIAVCNLSFIICKTWP